MAMKFGFSSAAMSMILQFSSCIIIILATMVLARWVRRWFKRTIDRSMDEGGADTTRYNFIMHLVNALIYIGGIGVAVYMIPSLRSLSLSFFAGSGVLAVVIGFASQQALGNLVSGTFIAIFKPFRIGDRIKMMGKEVTGVVEDITLRHTIIRTYENKRIIVPNSLMSTEIIENSNLIDAKVCKFLEIGISYDSDINKAIDIMRAEAERHPKIMDNRDEEQKAAGQPMIVVRVLGFGDSSVNLRAWVWAEDQPTAFEVACDLHKSIKERFDQEGIEIPFPHRTLVYKNPDPNKLMP